MLSCFCSLQVFLPLCLLQAMSVLSLQCSFLHVSASLQAHRARTPARMRRPPPAAARLPRPPWQPRLEPGALRGRPRVAAPQPPAAALRPLLRSGSATTMPQC